MAHIHNQPYEALLDSGSTISSISLDLVHSLHLPTSSAPPINVIFGDKQKTLSVINACTLHIHTSTTHIRAFILCTTKTTFFFNIRM